MSRTVYVNGAWLPEAEATISVFDRGFLFADGVYEVTSVLDGRLVDFAGHLARLHRSLDELEMPAPVGDDELLAIHRELVARNALDEGMVYLQVTRGAADRDFAWPAAPRAEPRAVHPGAAARRHRRRPRRHPGRSPSPTSAGRGATSRPCSCSRRRWARWRRRRRARTTPGWSRTASSPRGRRATPTSSPATGRWSPASLSSAILHGITRAAVLRLAAEAQLRVEERAFTVAEARARPRRSSPRPRPSSPRSSRSTAGRSATAAPAR